MSEPNWKSFEISVAEFISKIGHGAKVTHDAKIPDVHTDFSRQRDVWVEWDFGGHFPARALISCKYYSSVLDQQDIDHFNGEFISSGAQIGIVYSKSGFNDRALQKAKVLNFHCCQLLEDEAPSIPDAFTFAMAYCFRPQIIFRLTGNVHECGFKTWNDPFSYEIHNQKIKAILIDELKRYFALSDGGEKWGYTHEIYERVLCFRDDVKEDFDVYLQIKQDAYMAKVEFIRASGSYNLTHNKFIGSQSTPWVDTRSSHPGDGWEKVSSWPASQPNNTIVLYNNPDAELFVEGFCSGEFPKASD